MKKIISFIIGLLLLSSVPVFAIPITLGFEWDPNSESDIKEYKVFRVLATTAPFTPSPATDAVICIVQHPTIKCLSNVIGDFTGSGTLRFYAVARDISLNQSGPSNVVLHTYDFVAPYPPTIFRIVDFLGIKSLMMQEVLYVG
jgi:hypothetical protein